MTKDEIICMAREVGAAEPVTLYGRTDYIVLTRFELERFANLVVAATQEACAKMCEAYITEGIGREMAAAIRGMENK